MTAAYRIIVADDEREIQRYYAQTLQQLGHEVVAQASDGLQLIAACEKDTPDLIISDVNMPTMDGTTALEHIRRSQSIPCVFVTACDEQVSRQRAECLGCLAYLIKPVKRVDLSAVLRLLATSAAVSPATNR